MPKCNAVVGYAVVDGDVIERRCEGRGWALIAMPDRHNEGKSQLYTGICRECNGTGKRQVKHLRVVRGTIDQGTEE